MPSLLKLRKFARSPIKATGEPLAPSPMFQSGNFDSNFETSASLNNSDFTYGNEDASGESSPETPRPYQNGISAIQSSCYDDDILFQVEVNATGVETYATSTGNPPSSGSSGHRHWHHRHPPPSSNSSSDSYQQLLSSSFDKYAHGHTKPVTHQFRALTPPSTLFHKQSSNHRAPNTPGLTVHPTSRPYSIAGQAGPAANQNAHLPTYQECILNSAPCNSAATTPGNNTDLGTPAAPPPSIVTGPPTSNSSNKVILYPYVFRPVRPSKSSGQISSVVQGTASVLHHNSRTNGRVNNEASTSSSISPGTNGLHVVHRPLSSTELHYPTVNGGNSSARKQKLHSNQAASGIACDFISDTSLHCEQLMSTSLQLPSNTHCRTDCPSINSVYSTSGMMDLETQLRWKDTELKQLRSTMQNNESAMTKLLEETAQEYERKLNSERQKSSRLEAALKNKGLSCYRDVCVQTSAEDLYQLHQQSQIFESERSRWLEEKAKVIAYQRQIQLSYLQIVRKCQRLENDIQQLNKELEEKDKQLLLTSEFSQLDIEQLQHFSGPSLHQQQALTNPLFHHGMKRSASSDDKMSVFLHLDPEETAC